MLDKTAEIVRTGQNPDAVSIEGVKELITNGSTSKCPASFPTARCWSNLVACGGAVLLRRGARMGSRTARCARTGAMDRSSPAPPGLLRQVPGKLLLTAQERAPCTVIRSRVGCSLRRHPSSAHVPRAFWRQTAVKSGLFAAICLQNALTQRQIGAYSGKWQATRWPGASSASGGSWVRQMSWVFQQRVWNRQAPGGFSGLGASPVSRILRLRRVGSSTGTAESMATV